MPITVTLLLLLFLILLAAALLWRDVRRTVNHERAAQQRDGADEGRLDAYGSIVVGTVIVNQGEVVRPSQLIASVGPTPEDDG